MILRESETFEDHSIENISIVLYDRIELLNKKVNTFEKNLKDNYLNQKHSKGNKEHAGNYTN